jgi:methylenetetrahydrofolate dehydrogenase (NADP+) / methenyltetrahydrofolate cyclohydrolase
MAASIIDGKSIARAMQEGMKAEVAELAARGIVPRLEVVLVGDDPGSHAYVRNKELACERVGIASNTHRLPADAPREEVLRLIDSFNSDLLIHGILVQLPLPRHFDEKEIVFAIDPGKDVDGLHPYNVGRMVIGEPGFLPCTPLGIQQLLLRSGVETKGRHVVVVGRSNLVGKPIANMLLQKKSGADAAVTVVHTAVPDIAFHTRQADILIVAAGKPEMITADMVKDGAVVIDVGMNRIDDPANPKGFHYTGDVHFESVEKKASLITPVPGGVGPMTITMLLHNTIQSARKSALTPAG